MRLPDHRGTYLARARSAMMDDSDRRFIPSGEAGVCHLPQEIDLVEEDRERLVEGRVRRNSRGFDCRSAKEQECSHGLRRRTSALVVEDRKSVGAERTPWEKSSKPRYVTENSDQRREAPDAGLRSPFGTGIHEACAEHPDPRMLFHEIYSPAKRLIDKLRVWIQRQDELATGFREGQIVSRGITEISTRLEEPYGGILFRHERRAAVGRRIVDHDDLVGIARGESLDRSKTGAEQIAGIPVNDQNAEHGRRAANFGRVPAS